METSFFRFGVVRFIKLRVPVGSRTRVSPSVALVHFPSAQKKPVTKLALKSLKWTKGSAPRARRQKPDGCVRGVETSALLCNAHIMEKRQRKLPVP